MSREDVQTLLADYKAFLALLLKDKDFNYLRNLITRIFDAVHTTSSSKSYSPLAYIDPRHDLSWLPGTQADSMPPRKGKGKGNAQQNPSQDLNETTVDTTINPPPSQANTQHEHHPGYPGEHPPSSQHAIADQSANTAPFYDNGTQRPVLPPIGSFYEGRAAPTTQYSAIPSAQAYNSTASSDYRMPAVSTYSREAPSPHSIHPAPLVSHIRTGSTVSSTGYSQPEQPQFSGSVTSHSSLHNHILTPANSNTGQTASWQLQPTDSAPCNVEPSQRPISVMGPPRLPPLTPTASISSGRLASMPPPISQPSQQAVIAPAQPPVTSTLAPLTAQNPGLNPNSDLQGCKAPPAPATTSKLTRSGGPAYVTEAERAHEHKNWRLHEDGFLLQYFLNPTDPQAPQRLQQVLAPQAYNGPRPYNRRVFLDLAAHPQHFNNTCPVQQIYEHFLKLQETLTDIQRFRQYFPIEWAGEMDDEALLRKIQRQINELRTQHGVRISISPWRLHQYIMQSWYHWLRASALNNLPAVQTTTRFYSGNISPPASIASAPPASVASAPSALPTQASVTAPTRARAPTPLRPPTETAVPSPAPPTPQQATNSPHNNQSALPSHEDTTATSTPPRTPSVSSLRISRDASSGRLARRNISSSVYSRSGGGSGSTGQTPTHSDVSSVSGLSRATNSPAVVSEPTSAELVRQGQRQLELQERDVKENARVADLTRTLMQATFDFSHQESAQRLEIDQQRVGLDRQRIQLEEQRLQLEEQRLQLERRRLQLEGHNQVFEVERLALASVAAQMSLGVVPGRMPGISLGSQNSLTQAGGHQPLTPAVPTFNEWLDQARAYYAHSMGYPGLAPTSSAAPDYSTPTAAQQHMSGAGAGSSNHARRLRGFTPPASQAQIEDMGTVRGTPRTEAVGDDSEDVVGMELEYEDEGEDGDGNGMGYGEQS